MSYTLHSSLSPFTPTKSATTRVVYHHYPSKVSFLKLPTFSCSCLPNNTSENQASVSSEGDNGSSDLVFVERYSDGSAKRYIWDGRSSKFLLEQQSTASEKQQELVYTDILTWLPDSIKDFILPAGFPGSVSDDYLDYLLWQFPTNVTGWICYALVTSSLLKAVGVGTFSGSAAAASAAAIRWVSKDGIGAVGRLIVGGRFGRLFDDDPKQWRMYADFIGSAGSIFELTTPLYPAYFLPLASLGNLAKAVARGLKDPSFRVIQNHFAVSGNLGEVSAKEEVWEVMAQFVGLALGILILDTPGLVKSYPSLLTTWTSVRLFHLWLRFQSLSVLKFNTINLKRARILSRTHVLHSKVYDCTDCNKAENILIWDRFLKPRMLFGVPLDELLGDERSYVKVKKICNIYSGEKYVLAVDQWQRKDFMALVAFKEGATSMSVLRSVWQVYWLYENWNESVDDLTALEESLSNLEVKFDEYVLLLEAAGWDMLHININVPKDPYVEVSQF